MKYPIKILLMVVLAVGFMCVFANSAEALQNIYDQTSCEAAGGEWAPTGDINFPNQCGFDCVSMIDEKLFVGSEDILLNGDKNNLGCYTTLIMDTAPPDVAIDAYGVENFEVVGKALTSSFLVSKWARHIKTSPDASGNVSVRAIMKVGDGGVVEDFDLVGSHFALQNYGNDNVFEYGKGRIQQPATAIFEYPNIAGSVYENLELFGAPGGQVTQGRAIDSTFRNNIVKNFEVGLMAIDGGTYKEVSGNTWENITYYIPMGVLTALRGGEFKLGDGNEFINVDRECDVSEATILAMETASEKVKTEVAILNKTAEKRWGKSANSKGEVDIMKYAVDDAVYDASGHVTSREEKASLDVADDVSLITAKYAAIGLLGADIEKKLESTMAREVDGTRLIAEVKDEVGVIKAQNDIKIDDSIEFQGEKAALPLMTTERIAKVSAEKEKSFTGVMSADEVLKTATVDLKVTPVATEHEVKLQFNASALEYVPVDETDRNNLEELVLLATEAPELYAIEADDNISCEIDVVANSPFELIEMLCVVGILGTVQAVLKPDYAEKEEDLRENMAQGLLRSALTTTDQEKSLEITGCEAAIATYTSANGTVIYKSDADYSRQAHEAVSWPIFENCDCVNNAYLTRDATIPEDGKLSIELEDGTIAEKSLLALDENPEAAKYTIETFLEENCVKDPVAMLQALITWWENENIKNGISNAGDQKLINALDALTAANADLREDAINKLNATISWVEAQRGVHLTDAQADYSIAELEEIILLL